MKYLEIHQIIWKYLLFCTVFSHSVEDIADEGLETGLDMLHDDAFWYVGILSRQFGGGL